MSIDEAKLREQLEALKLFPNNKLVRELRLQIKSKLERLERKEKTEKIQEDRKIKANLSRSNKLKKYHRYIKLIRNNFPELSHADIRKQFSLRKHGKEVLIPDVVWQNPSP